MLQLKKRLDEATCERDGLAKEASSRILHDEYIGFASRNGYEGKPIKVYVLSCEDEVELFLNGEPMGKAKVGDKEIHCGQGEWLARPVQG